MRDSWEQAISEIESSGYVITVTENNITFRWAGKGDPSREKLLPLFKIVKANKDEIVDAYKMGLRGGQITLPPSRGGLAIPDENVGASNIVNDSSIPHKEIDRNGPEPRKIEIVKAPSFGVPHDFRWIFRPRFLCEVVGNRRTKQRLINIITSGSLPKGLLLYGPPGTAKTTLAHLFVKALCCENFDGDVCGKCKYCLLLKDDFSGGITYYIHDCSRIDSKDLERIIDNLRYSSGWNPINLNIHIFDEFHRTREPLQEKLLQTLEFQKQTLLIFCLIDFSKIKDAFRQRVEILRTSPPEITELIPWLNRICDSMKIAIKDPDALRQMAVEANRLPRECLALLQSIHNLKEPLTVDLVREVAQDRQGSCTNGQHKTPAKNKMEGKGE